jgi:exodeoxyribonuclease VII small subunit
MFGCPPGPSGFRRFAAAAADRFEPILTVQMQETADIPQSFEAALAELEAIVATMESGQLPLKESLAAYQRGALLLQFCQQTLKDAEQQVQVLEKGVLKAFAAPGSDGGAGNDQGA